MNRGTGPEETGEIFGFARTRRAVLRSCLTAFLVLSLVEAGSKIARAVPALGVATTGTYYSSGPTQAYQTFFAKTTASASTNGGYEGFGIGPSGSALDVFSNISGEDIYLLTNAAIFTANSPTFDGKPFSQFSYSSGKISSNYTPKPFYGIDLGQVGSTGWSSLPKPPFTPGSFYDYSGTLGYTGTIAQGSYFFAVATTSTSAGLNVTNFSPATTGAVGTGGEIANTPENPTLLLTGSALLFLAVFGLRRKGSLRA